MRLRTGTLEQPLPDAVAHDPSSEGPPPLAELPTLDSVGKITRIAQTTGELYLRIGPRAEDPGPRDPESGYRLPGVPACSLLAEPWWLDSTATWMARQLARRAHLVSGDAVAQLITGSVAGRDADGRPLIAPAHPLAWISPSAFVEAEAMYRSWRESLL